MLKIPMLKINRRIVLLLILTLLGSHSFVEASSSDRALEILQKSADNLKATDRIQYDVTNRFSYRSSVPLLGGFPNRTIVATVRRGGIYFDVVSTMREYIDGEFISSEKLHQVLTPVFSVVGFIESDHHEDGMVTTKQAKEHVPGLFAGGQYGFELDGYLGGDDIRVLELILMEPDTIRFIGESEINGFVCKQIDADTSYGFFSIYIDSENGYIIRRAVATRRHGDLLHGGNKYFHDTSLIETFTFVLDNLEFQLLGNNIVATKGVLQLNRRDINGDVHTNRSEYERTNIVLNPIFDANIFTAAFLEGGVVANLDDQESGVIYIWDGEQAIPAFTYFEGRAFMQGYAGFLGLFSMLLGIALVAYALYRMFLKTKKISG